MRNLRVGVPSKGRLSELATELLQQAGFNFRRQERSLFARAGDSPVEFTFLRTDDIPVLCAEGAIDMGITGSDLVLESEVQVDWRLRLGVGRCRLAMCVPEESPVHTVTQLQNARVATTFPRLTRKFLQKHDVEVHLVHLSGSIEVMTTLGMADAIVDLVETGSTLAANRLRVLEEIGQYESVLIQGPGCQQTAMADRLVRRVEGVVIARSYSLLEYNIPKDQLAAAEAITPGYRSPTVTNLEDQAWCAVRVMVPRKDVVAVMEKLEAVGASAILETTINNCRL